MQASIELRTMRVNNALAALAEAGETYERLRGYAQESWERCRKARTPEDARYWRKSAKGWLMRSQWVAERSEHWVTILVRYG